MVALGHSGLTGWNSDSANPRGDALQNSWASGTNPAVDSIYQRLLTRDPALEGHNFNVAKDGSNVDDLPRQVVDALAQEPRPDLFILQAVDNDIRCDGTDDQNYGPYGEKMATVLSTIQAGAPDAQIWLVGQPVTVQNYTDATQTLPQAVSANQGEGLCNLFDAAGHERPEAIATIQGIVDSYHGQLRSSCAKVQTCHVVIDEVQHMIVSAEDVTADTNHLSVQGQAKMADVVWSAMQASTSD